MKTHLIFVIGPTNAGKGTLLEAMKRVGGDRVGLVEVGKMFRAKYLDPASPHYQPDYFKGQAAPSHTANEAWWMMVEALAASVAEKREVILVDGQPRDTQQCEQIHQQYEINPAFDVRYAHVYATEEVRRERATKRDAGDAAKLALSFARMQGDAIKLYEVLSRLISYGSSVATIVNDGNGGSSSMDLVAKELLQRLNLPEVVQ